MLGNKGKLRPVSNPSKDHCPHPQREGVYASTAGIMIEGTIIAWRLTAPACAGLVY